MPVVDRSNLAPVATIRRDHPDVRVLHGGLQIREAAPGRLIYKRLTVGRPPRPVLCTLSGGQPADRAGSYVEGEDIVVEKLILIRLAVRNESDLLPVRRPVNRMLVAITRGKLPNGAGRELDCENVQSPIIIEAAQPFVGVRFIEIAPDHNWVASGFGGLRARDG